MCTIIDLFVLQVYTRPKLGIQNLLKLFHLCSDQAVFFQMFCKHFICQLLCSFQLSHRLVLGYLEKGLPDGYSKEISVKIRMIHIQHSFRVQTHLRFLNRILTCLKSGLN